MQRPISIIEISLHKGWRLAKSQAGSLEKVWWDYSLKYRARVS